MEVHADRSLPGHPELFVVGDLMALNGLPGLAEVAMQSGHHAARTIVRRLRGDEPFRVVVSIGRLPITGLAGWLMWQVLARTRELEVRDAARANPPRTRT